MSQASEIDFLDRIASDAYREAMKDVFSTCATLGLTVYWGTKGASIRISTTDRSEPLSIGWAFLEGDQWNGARHLSLGVDQSSLQQTPSVKPAVLAFVDRVKAITGAKPVQTKLDAYTFDPDAVPVAKEAIIGALEALVEAAQSHNES
jgi:hypothetical protein